MKKVATVLTAYLWKEGEILATTHCYLYNDHISTMTHFKKSFASKSFEDDIEAQNHFYNEVERLKKKVEADKVHIDKEEVFE